MISVASWNIDLMRCREELVDEQLHSIPSNNAALLSIVPRADSRQKGNSYDCRYFRCRAFQNHRCVMHGNVLKQSSQPGKSNSEDVCKKRKRNLCLPKVAKMSTSTILTVSGGVEGILGKKLMKSVWRRESVNKTRLPG